jgi:hypothetical protein
MNEWTQVFGNLRLCPEDQFREALFATWDLIGGLIGRCTVLSGDVDDADYHHR